MEIAQRCSFNQGDTIGHKYQVVSTLGEGTFGVVYLVTDSAGTKYALKLLRLWEVHPEIREPLMKRFDMEFETGLIKCDYLAHSVAHGIVQGNPYIVMEFCSGGDLFDQLKKGDINFSVVATHVLLGLKALHRNGKVHRDLKPENVLMKHDGTYVLTDFGISGDRNKRMTERNILGKPKQIFGTYAYMPPEQVKPKRDATVLPTTDVFSFGVMMYQLITGQLPFGKLGDEHDLVQYLRNIREANWNRSLLANARGGKEWMRLMEGCLEPDFKKRLQNVDEVLKLVPNSSTIPVRHEEHDFQMQVRHGLQLRMMQGEEHGVIYRLDDMVERSRCAIISMGRKDAGVHNDIEIVERDSFYISRNHCTLELDYVRGEWVVRDGQWMDEGRFWKRSTNGTFVNSTEVTDEGTIISPGDIISMGDVKLRAEGY